MALTLRNTWYCSTSSKGSPPSVCAKNKGKVYDRNGQPKEDVCCMATAPTGPSADDVVIYGTCKHFPEGSAIARPPDNGWVEIPLEIGGTTVCYTQCSLME